MKLLGKPTKSVIVLALLTLILFLTGIFCDYLGYFLVFLSPFMILILLLKPVRKSLKQLPFVKNQQKLDIPLLSFFLFVYFFIFGTALIALHNPDVFYNYFSGDKKSYQQAYVVEVIDGDTIKVKLENGKTKKVRYIGINCPEIDRPYGKKSREFNRKLVSNKRVKLLRDVRETDRYGRLLRYVYVKDIFVNAELVKYGYARVMTVPPDIKHSELFKRLERKARSKELGLWGEYEN